MPTRIGHAVFGATGAYFYRQLVPNFARYENVQCANKYTLVAKQRRSRSRQKVPHLLLCRSFPSNDVFPIAGGSPSLRHYPTNVESKFPWLFYIFESGHSP